MISYFSDIETEGVNYGESTRLSNDIETLKKDSLSSLGPSLYTQDIQKVVNCDRCLTVDGNGPRTSQGSYSYGVSTFSNNPLHPTFESVSVENMLSGRESTSKGLKGGRVTTINMNKYTQKLNHKNICPKILNPITSSLNMPVKSFREMTINRFYDLNLPIELTDSRFSYGRTTRMEAKDNHVEKMPYMIDQKSVFN